MKIYSVHCPPGADPFALTERVRFERQAFSWAAFFFGPLWLLARGLWRAFVVWALLAALAAGAVEAGYLSVGAAAALWLLAELYLGLEGAALADASFGLSRWTLAGIVAGDGRVEAERAYFLRQPGSVLARPPSFAPGPAPSSSQVIGLFPEAGG